MKKTLSLEGQRREHTGSKEAARLRRQGRLPAVIYGHKQPPAAITLDAHAFEQGIHHGHRLVEVTLGDGTERTVVKDLQYDTLGKTITHADLLRVDVDERVRVTVPLELKGLANAKAVHEGGIIEEQADHIEIECTVIDLPETVVVPVKHVGVGDTLFAKDIPLPEGITLVTSPDTVIVTCHAAAATKSAEEATEAEEEPGAPEVITERKPKDEAENE